MDLDFITELKGNGLTMETIGILEEEDTESRSVFLYLKREHLAKLLPKMKVGQHAVLLKFWESKIMELSRVVGVEMVKSAVEDAKYNAAANGLKNADFICGKVENTLSSVFTKEGRDQSDVVAIADPPRGGLHPKVIQAIRKCSNIKRLIYVSCNPAGAANNFTDLCRPHSNRMKGLPFCPTRAVPVDLFPHTSHCELVVVFERVDPFSVIKLIQVDEKKQIIESESKVAGSTSDIKVARDSMHS